MKKKEKEIEGFTKKINISFILLTVLFSFYFKFESIIFVLLLLSMYIYNQNAINSI